MSTNLQTARDILENLAESDKNDPGVIKGFVQPRIRTLQKLADEVASEHGIPGQSEASKLLAEVGYSPKQETDTKVLPSTPKEEALDVGRDLIPYVEDPTKQLAHTLSGFTYGRMMSLAKELKSVEHADFSTPEGIAALLNAWATKTLSHGQS